MKWRAVGLLAMVGLLVVAAPARQPNPGTLGPPENFLVTQNNSIYFSWDPVEGATKYSVPVCGEITYSDGTDRYTTRFKYEFSTADGIGTTYERSGKIVLEVPKTALARLVLARIQEDGIVDPADVVGFLLEASAKVKALNPGRGNGPQNNPFSDPDDFEFLWYPPNPV